MSIDVKNSLIEWANQQGSWAQFLLSKCLKNNEITKDDLQYFIDSINNNDLQINNFELTKLPSKKITLKSLLNISGVNKLSNNQKICFSPNITVLYGVNGSGKTGYVRILKQIGSSLDKNNILLPNLDNKNFEDFKTEIIYMDSDGKENQVIITDQNIAKLNIKIFNHDCVAFSLKDKKEVQFQPREFEYFNLISKATNDLYTMINNEISNSYSNLRLIELIDGTNAKKTLDTLIANGNQDVFNEYCEAIKNPEDIQTEISNCEKQLKTLNVELIEKNLASLRKIKDKLSECLVFFLTKSNLYSNKFWQEIINNNDEYKKLSSETTRISEIIDNLSYDKTQQEKLKELLLALDSFTEAISQPLETSIECPICHQSIYKNETKELFEAYSSFIKKDNTKKIKLLDKELQSKEKTINSFIDKLRIDEEVLKALGYDKKSISTLLGFFNNLQNLRTVTELFDFDIYRKELEDEIKFYESLIKKCDESISNNDSEKIKIITKRNELISDKLLIENKEQILSSATRIYLLNKYTIINNHSLSALQKKILESNYQENYVSTLKTNLKILRAPETITFEPKITTSNLGLKQKYFTSENNLNDILSEGEQTVVALAHFITENSLQEDDNVLVFDDPVNSLDLERMDIVAKCLVNNSFNKQIIIFTHNLVFLNAIDKYIKKLEQMNKHYYCITSNESETGILEEGLPNTQNFKFYKTKAYEIVELSQKRTINEMEIKQGYSYIRSAIEVLVVDTVFNGTVKRYQSEIHMGNFERIKYNEFSSNFARIVALFDTCCDFTEAHSSSEHRNMQPTIKHFVEDYNELIALYNIFKQNN